MTKSGKASAQQGIRQRSLRKHCRLGRATELVFILATGVTLSIGGGAQAQSSLTWDTSPAAGVTGANGNWNTNETNWTTDGGVSNQAFVNNDSVTFSADPGPLSTQFITVDEAGLVVDNITIDTINDGDVQIRSDDPTSAANALTVTGQLNVVSNAVIQTGILGDLVSNVGTGASLQFSVQGVTGNLQVTGDATLIDILTTVGGGLDSDGGNIRINAAGANNGSITGATTIDNSTIQIQSGNLSAGNAVTMVPVSTVTINNGGTLDADGGTIGAVTLNLGGAADLGGGTVASFTQDAAFVGQTFLNGSMITGTTDINGGTFTFISGTLGDVDNAATFSADADVTVGGDFDNETGGVVSFNGGGAVSNTLTVNGATGFTTAGNLNTAQLGTTIAASTITLNSGAQFNGGSAIGGATGSVNAVILDGAVVNNTTLTTQGAVTLTGGFTNNGTFTVTDAITSGANLLTNTGTLDINTGGSISGAVTASDGTVTVDAAQDGTAEVGGTLTIASDIVAGTTGALLLTDGDLGDIVNNGLTDTNGLNGTVDDMNAANDGVEITVTAGVVNTLTNNSGEAVLNGGVVTTTTDVAGGTVTNNGASLTGLTTTSGTGTFTQTDGAANGGVENDGGTVNLDGGTAASLTNTANAGVSTVTDGEVTGTTTITGGSVVVNDAAVDMGLELQGDTTIGADGTLTVTAGQVDDVINNGGTVTFATGTAATTLDNNANGDADFDGTVTIGATITNAGTLDINTGVTTASGGTTNEANGVLTIDSGAGLASNVVNESGRVNVDGTLTGTLDNRAGGVVDISTNGDVTGQTTNASDLNIDGGTIGSLDNNTGGDADFDGDSTVDNGITNAAALDINTDTTTVEDGSGGVGTTTNEMGGRLTIANMAELVSNTVNEDGGNLVVTGTLTGTLDNQTTGMNSASITGDVDGAVTNTGNLDVNGGSMGSLDNNMGGDADFDGTVLVDNGITNAAALDINTGTTTVQNGMGGVGSTINEDGGTLSVAIGATLASNVTNNLGGTLNVTGGAMPGDPIGTINGDVINNGAATLTGNVSVTGDYTQEVEAGSSTTVNGTTTIGGALSITMGTLDVTDGSSITATGGASTAGGTIDGEVNNDLNSTGQITVTSTGDINGTLTNSGTLSSNAGEIDALVNSGGTFENTGMIVGLADINGGTFTMNGGTVGRVENDAITEVSGNSSVTGALINNGTLNIQANQRLSASTIENESGSITVGTNATLAGTGNTLNNGTLLTVADGGTVTDAGAINNLGTGTITFEGDGTLAADDNAVGDEGITNAGIINFNGGMGTTVNVTTGGAGTFTSTAGTITVADGSGVDLTGVGAVGLTNQAALDINTGASVTGNIENTGTTTVDGTLTGTLDNQTGGVTDITDDGDVDGAVTNAGDLNVNGGSLGSLDNNMGGDADFDGDVLVDTTITNAAALDINSGTTTASGGTTNEANGVLTIDMGAELASNTVNQSGGDLNIDGTLTGTLDNQTGGVTDITDDGDVDGAVTNAGDLNVNGGSLGSLLNNAGGDADFDGLSMVDNGITNFAALDVNSGSLTVQDGLGGVGTTLNQAGGTLTIADGSFLASNVTNNGITNLAGQVTGNVDGTGTLNITDNAATITGDLSTMGASELNIEGSTTTLTVGGNANLSGNITVDATTGTVGNLNVGGNVAGNVTLTFDGLDAATAASLDNVLLVNFGGTNTLNFADILGLPVGGGLDFVVDEIGNQLVLGTITATAVNTVAATVGLTQTLVDTVVNRPTSPFVADLAAGAEEKPCGVGGWVRATGGTANADGTFTDVEAGVTGESPVGLNYAGLQFGGDFACFGGHYNGWDLAFGGIAGFNDATSTSNAFSLTGVLENTLESDIFQSYAGVYATAARGRFFADLQLRFEDTQFESTNRQLDPGGLADFESEYDNAGQTVSGAVGYSWPIGQDSGLTFVSSAGFSFTKNETDDVDLGADGALVFEDGFSRVGFLSASLAKTTILPDEISALSYFGTATVYNDFADDRTAFFVPTGSTAGRELAIENLGAYGEVSLGLNYLRLLSPGEAGNARQLNASVRVDARFSGNVESYGITGQFRLQF